METIICDRCKTTFNHYNKKEPDNIKHIKTCSICRMLEEVK